MRRIICRFRSKEDLDTFSKKINLILDEDVKEVYMDTLEVFSKRGITNREIYIPHKEWMDEWVDMPEWSVYFKDGVYAKIDFYFSDNTSLKELSNLFENSISKSTTSVWFPKLKIGVHRDFRVIGGRKHKYPIFVVSKGRYLPKLWHSSTRLSQMCVEHFLVVEPQELELYSKNFTNPYVTIIPMDLEYKKFYDVFSNLGNTNSTGPGAARNFCIDLARKWGYKYCHIWDDNIDGTNLRFRGHRLLNRSEEMFATLEEFVERYENVPLAGFNYSSFCVDGNRQGPYISNTRIYSMIMIETSGKWYFRGRYNEDTDLSLRVLKEGLCTIQLNAFLGEKLNTQKVKGGNTDEFYDKDEGGTIPKTQMLYDMHPDVTKIVYKFRRVHHVVDYSGFTQPLKRVNNYNDIVDVTNKVNNKGLKIVKVPSEIKNILEIDNYKNLMDKYYNREDLRIDNTNIYL